MDRVSRTQKTITKPLMLFYRDTVKCKALRSEKCKCETELEQTSVRNVQENLGILKDNPPKVKIYVIFNNVITF